MGVASEFQERPNLKELIRFSGIKLTGGRLLSPTALKRISRIRELINFLMEPTAGLLD
jgi:hypothetical protein